MMPGLIVLMLRLKERKLEQLIHRGRCQCLILFHMLSLWCTIAARPLPLFVFHAEMATRAGMKTLCDMFLRVAFRLR
jgi:hypothetical protein